MVKIEILGENADEALANLRAFLNGGADHTEPETCTPVAPPAPVMPAPSVPTAQVTPAPAGILTRFPAPATTAPMGGSPTAPISPVPVAPPAPPVVPTTPAPGFTVEQISNAGAALVQAGKMADLMALLGQYGVQAVTELKPEQYGPFATALRGMGANI